MPDEKHVAGDVQEATDFADLQKMHLMVILAKQQNRLPRAILVTCALAIAVSAAAQQGAIEDCRKATTDAARIACLEAALATDDAHHPATPPEESRSPRGTSHSESQPEASTADGEEVHEAGAIKTETDREPAAASRAEAPSDTAPADDNIGSRQVRARQQTRAEAEASLESAIRLPVYAYAVVPYRRLQVTLTNGQVWRQIVGDTQRIRVDLERNRTVDIHESGIGGYTLRLNEIERTIRVERVR